jgi:hypothetical protein
MTKSFDHLLRETLKAAAPEPPDGCLDAGVLAAWFEGTLDPAERTAAGAHAADCSRCQAALAAMIRIEPPTESRPWWRSPAFGWLVPITVAAAALVIFIRPYWWVAPEVAVQQHAPAAIAEPVAPAPSPATRTAELDALASATTPRPEAQPGMRQVAKAEARDDARKENALAKRRRDAYTEAPASPPVLVPPLVENPSLKDRVGVPVDESALQRAAAAAAARPAPPPAVSQPARVVAAGTPSVVETAPARPSEDSSRADAIGGKAVTESVALNARTTVPRSLQPLVLVQAADGPTRWRITEPGSVQRSNDAGASWETQSTGVFAVISNGAAPSASVCWLVGKAGLVLLSADGRSWRRVPFPQAVDLTSVVATDANTATVTAASGRKFTTSDGGKSWK